eukprot:EG_transcript_66522
MQLEEVLPCILARRLSFFSLEKCCYKLQKKKSSPTSSPATTLATIRCVHFAAGRYMTRLQTHQRRKSNPVTFLKTSHPRVKMAQNQCILAKKTPNFPAPSS